MYKDLTKLRFEDPLLSKTEIEEIKGTPEFQRKTSVPIKAAHMNTTCSMYKDPLIQRFQNIVQLHSDAPIGDFIFCKLFGKLKASRCFDNLKSGCVKFYTRGSLILVTLT